MEMIMTTTNLVVEYMDRTETRDYRQHRTHGMFALWVAIVLGTFSTMAFLGTGFQMTGALWFVLGFVALLLVIAGVYFQLAGRVLSDRMEVEEALQDQHGQ